MDNHKAIILSNSIIENIVLRYFPTYKQDGISFKKITNYNSFMTDDKTILYPNILGITVEDSTPKKYNLEDVLVAILHHEIGHAYHNDRPNHTFKQIVKDEALTHIWAINRCLKYENNIYAKILLAVFYNWRFKGTIQDDPLSSPKHLSLYKKNPYKEASLLYTDWIMNKIKKLNYSLEEIL